MSQILVWKSDRDGKLFESKEEYVKHLIKLATHNLDVRRKEKIKSQLSTINAAMGQVTSIRELEQFIRENWQFFSNNGHAHSVFKTGRYVPHTLVDLRLKITSFGRARANKLAWSGFIILVVAELGHGSNYFVGTPIHTGTGGGSHSRYRYDLLLYADDFPGLIAMQEKMETWCIMAGIDLLPEFASRKNWLDHPNS